MSKINKVWNWAWCENRTKCKALCGLCTFDQRWITEYATVAGPLIRISQMDVEFQWETDENIAMAILKEALCNAPALKMLDVRDGAAQIVIQVDASFEGQGAILQQEDKHKSWHSCHHESELWFKTEKRCDGGKCEFHGLMKALKTFGNYIYRATFLMESDVNTSVHELHVPANDLPGALVTPWITWI